MLCPDAFYEQFADTLQLKKLTPALELRLGDVSEWFLESLEKRLARGDAPAELTALLTEKRIYCAAREDDKDLAPLAHLGAHLAKNQLYAFAEVEVCLNAETRLALFSQCPVQQVPPKLYALLRESASFDARRRVERVLAHLRALAAARSAQLSEEALERRAGGLGGSEPHSGYTLYPAPIGGLSIELPTCALLRRWFFSCFFLFFRARARGTPAKPMLVRVSAVFRASPTVPFHPSYVPFYRVTVPFSRCHPQMSLEKKTGQLV